MARPNSGLDREVFRRAKEAFEQQQLDRTDNPNTVEYLADVLSWAIENELDGFKIDQAIGIAVAADGLKTSRTTMTQAVKMLVNRGQLIERPNSPYTVKARFPVIPDSAESGKSVRRQLGTSSWRGDVFHELRRLDDGSKEAKLARKELAHSLLEFERAVRPVDADKAVDEFFDVSAAQPPRELSVFIRWGFARNPNDKDKGRNQIWWREATLLRMDEETTGKLEARIRDLRARGQRNFSLYGFFESAELGPVYSDKNTLCVVEPEGLLARATERLRSEPIWSELELEAAPTDRHVRMAFRIFAPAPWGSLGFSTVYVRADVGAPVHLMVKRFSIEPVQPRK